MSVTVNGQPILLDHQAQLRNFLGDHLPSEDILFSRWLQDELPPNPLVSDSSDYLRPPYPTLPAIEIGEIQWPSGASRYARALYAVDWPTLLSVAEDAWGFAFDPDNPPDTIDDIPEVWGIDHYSVDVVIADGVRLFQAEMYPLPPYRVTGQGLDLWLLPMVDRRFLFNRRPHDPVDTMEDWSTLFQSLASEMGTTIATDAVPTEYGAPDPRLYQFAQPAGELLDLAALSVGLRIVREPDSGILRALSASSSDTRRDANGLDLPLLLSGGKRGEAAKPSAVEVFCQTDDEKTQKRIGLIGGGPGTVRLAVWASWFVEYDGTTIVNDSATANFVDQVAADVDAWFNGGGQFCWVGTGQYLPNGYDDFASIQVLEGDRGEYRFHSRIYELPAVFLPPAILANGRLCVEELFQYQLLTDWFGGLAVAFKRSMDGVDKPAPYVIVRDPLGVMDFQKKGYKGYMKKECGKYYVVNGPCPPVMPAPDPETPEGAGACCIPVSLEFQCQQTTEEQCAAAGGTWIGVGISCDPFPC